MRALPVHTLCLEESLPNMGDILCCCGVFNHGRQKHVIDKMKVTLSVRGTVAPSPFPLASAYQHSPLLIPFSVHFFKCSKTNKTPKIQCHELIQHYPQRISGGLEPPGLHSVRAGTRNGAATPVSPNS